MHRRTLIKAFALSASVVAMGMSFGVQAADTIKIGIMHSLSGTMAISEVSLRDVCMMAFDEINAKGGVMGRQVELRLVGGDVDENGHRVLLPAYGRQLKVCAQRERNSLLATYQVGPVK